MNDDGLKVCTLSRWTGAGGRCRWCDAELAGRRQRWCSDACAQAMIEQHWWGDARKAALARDGRRCVRCGRGELDLTLPPHARGVEVHHRDEHAHGRHSASSCCHHVDGLETVCKPCHWAEHRERPVPQRPRTRTRAFTAKRITNPRAVSIPVWAGEVLAALKRAGDSARSREVAAALGDRPTTAAAQTVSHRLTRLQRHGLVEGLPEYGMRWTLTEAGEAHLAALTPFEHTPGGGR